MLKMMKNNYIDEKEILSIKCNYVVYNNIK